MAPKTAPKTQKAASATAKSDKVQIRLHAPEKSLIARAAELRHTSLSQFMVEHACRAAVEVLAEHAYFTLAPDAWDRFCAALDEKPKAVPALAKLLKEPGIFDGR